MKLDISKVEFSNNDLNRGIVVPEIFTAELSEILGILIGDGHVGIYSDGYRIYISGNLSKDKEYYDENLLPLFWRNFHILPHIKIRKNEIDAVYSSKALVTFFVSVFNFPSNKRNISIPKIVIKSDNLLRTSFLRGLIDTDGCLMLKKKYRPYKYYPTISLTSCSKLLIEDVKNILDDLGIGFTFYVDEKYDRRYESTYIAYSIDINGIKNLHSWMNLIGFNNPRNMRVYEEWKKYRCLVGGRRFELPASTLSAWRSNLAKLPARSLKIKFAHLNLFWFIV